MGKIYLADDGTMDTVLTCDTCGEDFRYNYDPQPPEDDNEQTDKEAYDAFVAWAIEDAESDHECEG